jgi:hypothetical protein
MEILRGFLFLRPASAFGAASAARTHLHALLAFLLIGFALSSKAQDNPTEFQLKAAFLFNFAKFVTWPDAKLPTNAPIIIGVLGEDPFGPDLEKIINNKMAAGHPIESKRYVNMADAREAHILYISESERRRVAQILNALKGGNVLTVSDIDNFCDSGGIVNFRVIADKVRFEISTQAAEEQALKISSRLLTVAIKRGK